MRLESKLGIGVTIPIVAMMVASVFILDSQPEVYDCRDYDTVSCISGRELAEMTQGDLMINSMEPDEPITYINSNVIYNSNGTQMYYLSPLRSFDPSVNVEIEQWDLLDPYEKSSAEFLGSFYINLKIVEGVENTFFIQWVNNGDIFMIDGLPLYTCWEPYEVFTCMNIDIIIVDKHPSQI